MNNPSAPQQGAKTYEMLWDCKFCGTTKLLGKTHRFCPNCGGQQDPATRYFPSDAEKVAVEDHVYHGADKICPACQTPNSAKAEFCGNCGSPLDQAAAAQLAGQRRQDEGAAFDTENLQERQKQGAPLQTQAVTAQSGSSSGGKLKWIIGIIGLLVVGGVLFTVFSTKSASVYVSGHRWEREIRIESLQSFPGSGDCDRVPAGAYNLDRRYEEVGSKSVPDGQTCDMVQIDQGDGTFREERQCETTYRDEPVYDYVCYYTYNQWTYDRSVKTDGDDTIQPFWAEASIQSGSCLGCEQEAGREEAYYLVFMGDGGKTFECPVSKDVWDNTPLERAFEVKVGTVLQNVRCDTLEVAGT